jgi:hypothetical protein
MSKEEAAQLREVLREKIADLGTQDITAQSTPAPVTAPPVVAAPVPAAPAAAAPVVEPPALKPADAKRAAREAAAAEKKRLADEVKASQANSAKRTTAVTPEAKPVFTAVEAPPSSVPATKQARLDELLGKYKADLITAEQYHNERAKILAEP